MTDFYMRPLDMKNGAVDLTHGAGGRATAQLIHDVFGRHFTNAWLDEGHDGALLPPMTRPASSATSKTAMMTTPSLMPFFFRYSFKAASHPLQRAFCPACTKAGP